MDKNQLPQIDTLYQNYDRHLNKITSDDSSNNIMNMINAGQSENNSTMVNVPSDLIGSGQGTGTTNVATGGMQSGKQRWSDSTAGFFLGIDTDGIAKLNIGNVTSNLIWDGTSLAISGNLTATSGTIGGWTINTNYLSSGSVIINGVNEQLLFGSASAPLTGTGIFIGKSSGNYVFRAGDPTSQYIIWSGSGLNIYGGVIQNLGTGSDLTLMDWQFDATFSSSNYNTVAWTSGSLKFGNLVTYAISSGSITPLTTVTYIYFDSAASTTVLQTTTTAANAIGSNKVLIAVCNLSTDATKGATFQVFGGAGGIKQLITADSIAATTITANEIAANAITSSKLATTLLYAGAITLDVNGHIQGGQSGYDTGTGFFLGYSGSAYKFSIGIGGTTANNMTWDGTNLIINGQKTQSSDLFGLGTDGNVTISTPTTLTRDMYYDTLTVNDTLTTNGFIIYCRTGILGNGTVKFPDATNGGNGGNGATVGAAGGGGGSAGSAGTASTTGRLKNLAGGAGQAGQGGGGGSGGNGSSTTHGTGSAGVNAGRGGTASSFNSPATGGGGTGGTGGTVSIVVAVGGLTGYLSKGLDFALDGTSVPLNASAGSGGGGGGVYGSSAGGNDGQGGGGGGGGAGGGLVLICANSWGGTFTIRAVGGNGGNGGTGAAGSTGGYNAGGGGGGGGSGSSGGTSCVIYGRKTWAGSYVLTGGTAGARGTGGGGSENGSATISTAGSAGSTGNYYEIAT